MTNKINYNWAPNPKQQRRTIMENSKHYTYVGSNERVEAGTIVDRLIKRYTCDHPEINYSEAFKIVTELDGNKELFTAYTKDSSTLM